MEWYAVQTKAGQESTAERHLLNQAFDTFLPLLKSFRRRRGRWQTVIEPLFPGYLFVELDVEHQNTAPIRSTRGVIGLVRQGHCLRPLPRTFVDDLVAIQHQHGVAIAPDRLFEPGDEVTLIAGHAEHARQPDQGHRFAARYRPCALSQAASHAQILANTCHLCCNKAAFNS